MEAATERRYRSSTGPAILAQGFRPFFLAAGLWALAALSLSFPMIRGDITLPTAFDPISWHIHELLFGYVAAAIAGFLLTAIPNWTGRLPLHGMKLLGLVSLWLVGRLGVSVSVYIGPWAAAILDLSFLAALLAAAGREVLAGRNWRNLPVVLIVGLLFLANVLFHAEVLNLVTAEGRARRLAIAAIIMLIALIGGRVTPSFTRNWLAKRGEAYLPASFGRIDKAALAATGVALLWWVISADDAAGAVLLAVAAAMLLVRLMRWRGHATLREPLLWVLHLGYLWIPVGLGLLAFSHWAPDGARTAGLHALTVGAMATMTLAVMSRATLGHTGRALHAGPGLTGCYAMITLAAVLRVAAALGLGPYTGMLLAAAGTWMAAFVLFLAVCGPMLIGRRKVERA